MNKKEIRNLMRQKRDRISDEERMRRTSKICHQIQKDLDYQNATTVAIFYPMGNEIDLRGLITEDKTFVFPRVEKDGIHFYPYTDQTKFHQSPFGVMEPEGHLALDETIDYMLTPALAISKDGYRIGYGKGYYDQFLLKFRPKRVMGVIYDFQEVEPFNTDAHDQKLDAYYKG